MAAIPTAVVEPNFGVLRFNSANSTGDTVNLTLKELRAPDDGTDYAAWLLNTDDQSTLALGKVLLDPFGSSVLAYTDSDGRMLPAYFNAVIITEETSIGDAPAGTIVYRGEVPIEVTNSLRSILISDPSGFDGGSLVDGAEAEATIAAQHAGLAAKSTNVGGMKTHGRFVEYIDDPRKA